MGNTKYEYKEVIGMIENCTEFKRDPNGEWVIYNIVLNGDLFKSYYPYKSGESGTFYYYEKERGGTLEKWLTRPSSTGKQRESEQEYIKDYLKKMDEKLNTILDKLEHESSSGSIIVEKTK